MQSAVEIPFPKHRAHLKLSAPQKNYLVSKSKRRLMNCGRYGGKTFSAGHDVIPKAFRLYAEHKRNPAASWRPITRPGPIVTVGLFAPQEGNQKAMWNYFTDLAPRIPGKTDGWENTTILREGKIYFFGPMGIEYDFVSLWNEGGARSGGYDVGFVDEAGLIKRPTTFHQGIKPLVIRAGYFGDLSMASTPYNNFWDGWCASARDKVGAWKHWEYHHWTAFDNPYLTDEIIQEILAAFEEDPYGSRREYLAELFVETPAEDLIKGTSVWELSQLEDCWQTETLKLTGPFSLGLDLAWGGTDNAVLVAIDKPTNFICHIEIYPKTSDQDLIDILTRADQQWGNPDIHYDRTGSRARAFSDFIPKRFRIHPLIFRRSIDRNRHDSYIVSKDLLIRQLSQRMALKKLRFPSPEYNFDSLPWANQQPQAKNFAQLQREMLALKRVTVRKADGSEEYLYKAEAIRDSSHKYIPHDDCIDGTLLAARGLPAVEQTGITIEEFAKALSQNW